MVNVVPPTVLPELGVTLEITKWNSIRLIVQKNQRETLTSITLECVWSFITGDSIEIGAG